jgi:hypothetical protein
MSERHPRNTPAGDLPWNDVPADSDVVPGTEEPDPGEVEGDEGDEVDVSHPPIPDPSLKYQRETLDQRLAEEVPDRATREEDPVAGEFQAAESGEDDLSLELGESDEPDVSDGEDEAAEDAAVHTRPRDGI